MISKDEKLEARNYGHSFGSKKVGMGPGFEAGEDCHLVVETKRGHSLGRVITHGRALKDTGIPEPVAVYGESRVLRSPASGQIIWNVNIGDRVEEGQTLGGVNGIEILGPFNGIVRGLIHPSVTVVEKMKIYHPEDVE